jgi:hypothetical protein
MRDDRTYRDGYVEGWKAIMGGIAVPPISATTATYAATGGRTPFQEGIRRAVEEALKRKGEISN